VRLAVDANVLLAASLGGGTRSVFFRRDWLFFTTSSVVAEVEEHAPQIANRRGLSVNETEEAFRDLPIIVVPDAEFAHRLPDAMERIGKIDPDDVPLLALALALEIPVWSNDGDFKGTGVELLTSSIIMRMSSFLAG
jgi:predicted nucleic acid-binding protein